MAQRQRMCKKGIGLAFLLLFASFTADSYAVDAGEVMKTQTAQQRNNQQNIKGLVLDDFGEPIIGASVTIKGNKNHGTITNAEGRFSLNVPKGTTHLEISYIGMTTYELSLKTPKDLYKIRMKASDTELEEVVVTGVVNKMKESFTGSATTFTAQELKAVGTQNAIASLKTLDPSFNVLDSEFGSDPNRMPDIEIRGKSSLISTRDELAQDPNQPLFILDGFESTLEAIYNLDMNRIASITILKDAASTAIYGSKASNGVVVVETIKPKSGKLNLSYNGNANIQWADLTSYNLMNASEKLEFERRVGRYSNFNSTEQEIRLMQSYNKNCPTSPVE